MDRRTASSTVGLSPSRVGITGVETIVRLCVDHRPAQPFAARIECAAEPDPARPTSHGSRFADDFGDVVRDVVHAAEGMRAERLAQEVAERVRERRHARRAEVAIAARFSERRPAPVSGIPTQEIFTLHARAAASGSGTRRMLGVSAQGITTAPYAQAELVARSRERLAADGFSESQISRVLDGVPIATHDQLGVGTLHIGWPDDCALELDVAALLAIVEGAMSSEIFELMKRSDEGAVVERAHRRPRLAEECVHAMIAGVVERFADLPGEVFVSAAQENVETIHGHNVIAERSGLLGDLRRELATGQAVAGQASMRRWLEA